jgi:hypothetical protein
MRFRKSFKIAPGVRVTASNRGISTSIGGKGLRVTKRADGRVSTIVGIPGSGLSHTTTTSQASAAPQARRSIWTWKHWLLYIGIFTFFVYFLNRVGPHR